MLAWVVGIIYGPVSVSSQYSVETAERIELVFLAWELPSSYPTLC